MAGIDIFGHDWSFICVLFFRCIHVFYLILECTTFTLKEKKQRNQHIVTLESKGSICSFVSKWIQDICSLTKKQMSRIHFKKTSQRESDDSRVTIDQTMFFLWFFSKWTRDIYVLFNNQMSRIHFKKKSQMEPFDFKVTMYYPIWC